MHRLLSCVVGPALLLVSAIAPSTACSPSSDDAGAPPSSSPPTPIARDQVATTPRVAPAPPPKSTVEVDTSALVVFAGDDLKNCVVATVRVERTGAGILTAANESIMLADFTREGQSATRMAFVTGLLSMFADNRWSPCVAGAAPTSREQELCVDKPLSDAIAKFRASSAKDRDKVRALAGSWPTKEEAAQVARGEFARVASCPPNHVPLGVCHYSDETSAVAWHVDLYSYDVASTVDSDRAMKACLAIKGSWIGADPAEPEVLQERLRQHSKVFR